MRGDAVLVEVEGEELAVPLADIESARLVPEF
jgi:ribosome maturation factor RimP